MSCRQDIRKAILDEVFKLAIEGRYTFTRVGLNSVQINNRIDSANSKALSSGQAEHIAKEVISRVNREFYGHVQGVYSQASPYDPITISFEPSKAYIEHEYNNLPASQRNDTSEMVLMPSEERDHINNNSGINTNDILFSVNTTEQAPSGVYTKFIQFKKGQLSLYRNRLNKVLASKKKKDITTDELNNLNRLERELKLQIEGNFELNIKGLKQEISELVKNSTIDAVQYYIDKDLERLDILAKSGNIDDIREAQRLIDFYELAGTFKRGIENPFFTQEEIFLSDLDGNIGTEYRLAKEVRDKFSSWGNKASEYQNLINKRKEEITVNYINDNIAVKKTYGKKFSFNDLISDESGLKDADWLSMWTMDVTQGVFSTNGVIPQAMFSYLTNSFEKKLAWAKDIEERIDKINPEVQKELIKMGYSLRASGIVGLEGASYQLFKEITKEGNETGGLIQKFVKEFFDEQSSSLNRFHNSFDAAKAIENYNTRSVAFNKAFETLKRWRRNSTTIMDINKLPELGNTSQEAAAYKLELVQLLGEKTYNQQIEKQKSLLNKYEADKQSMIETLLIKEGVSDYNNLSDKAKSDLSYWETNHDPKKGIEDYYSVSGIFFGNRKVNNFMDYNNFIPRKFYPKATIDKATNNYIFSDTTTPTGYYSTDFDKIENNPILSSFYDIVEEVCQTIRENMPYELQQKVAVNTIPALLKSSAEIIADKNTGALNSVSSSFKRLSEKIRLGFGVVKQSELSYAITDPVTGTTNYKVNDQFIQGNTKAVKDLMDIEKAKFISSYNQNGANLKSINRFSVIPIDNMNDNTLFLLAEYTQTDLNTQDSRATNIKKLVAKTGRNVEIGKYIRDYSLHSVVQSQSFDLAKVSKYFSNMVMSYAARQEALPILEIMKKHYEAIQKPVTNNMDNKIFNVNDESYMKGGLRTNAIKQMDDWFERVVLDNYGTKHLGPHGDSTRSKKQLDKLNKRINDIDTQLQNNITQDEKNKLIAERERLLIKKNIPDYGKTIYSVEDKKKLGEIETLLKDKNLPKEEIEKLIKIKEHLGKARTATAFFDNVWAWIRTLRLGYNISSATTNLMEGVTSNMIISASGEYFKPEEIYYGYNVVKHSFIKNLTFGKAETALAKKNRTLMDKFRVIMDSKNELQKSSVRTYASKLSWMNPHELNQRVEYINQSPIMIAMLRSMEITDKNGNKSTLWDAYEKNGQLKTDFKTEENINNWERLQGDDYLLFKQKLHKAIVLAHGNYDELRGMMIKSNTAGKGLMMFKTWLPMQLYWRFATEQDDIQSNTIGYKGRYWSYGKGTAATHLGLVGTAVFGPLGAVAGGALGYFLGNRFGTDSGVSFLKEVVETNKQLFKKVIGIPVNVIAGRQVIKDDKSAFDNWVSGDFTQQDANNLRANMSDLTMQLAWLALILITKSLLWDDDDKPEDAERMAHNILVNKLMQLSSQAAMYVNPVDAYKNTIGSNAVIQYLTDVGKELDRVSEYLHGRDIIQSGIHAGESGLGIQSKKLFLPGIFKDKLGGFDTQAERVFEESPFHPYFKSEESLDKADNTRDRAERRRELEEQGLTDKEIKAILKEELPTQSQLKKIGKTRDEFEAEKEQDTGEEN